MARAPIPPPILRLQLRLLKASDDSAVFAEGYQTELRQFKQQLETAGLGVSPTFAVIDSAGAVKGLTGQFLLSWVPTLGSAPKTLGEIARAWVNGRAGRTLRLQVGDGELEADSPAEIDHWVAKAMELKAQLANAERTP